MSQFETLILAPCGAGPVTLAVGACRAGAVGVVNAEIGVAADRWRAHLDGLAAAGATGFGVKLASVDAAAVRDLEARIDCGLRWLLVDVAAAVSAREALRPLRDRGLRVVGEVLDARRPGHLADDDLDGLLVKGNEAGGFVGEDASFILLQKWLGRSPWPIYLRGGVTPQVAAAVHAVGVAGGVLDAQVLLFDEAGLAPAARQVIAALSGNETVAVGDGERGQYFRCLNRPGHAVAKAFVADGEGGGFDVLRGLVEGRIDWDDPKRGLLPVGHDVAFAAAWRDRYGHLAALVADIARAVDRSLPAVAATPPLAEGAPLARTLGIRLPIVQGPMTRVSDVAEFALAVAEGGALPMVAFALLKGEALERLLARTSALLGDRAWGIGLLGFAPQALLDEQLAAAIPHRPRYAIIAGGRPDQAVRLEAAGVPTFLHVPSANLVPMFVQEGARRFIFEGRECGGHIGPLSSFVLWSTMVDKLVELIDARKVAAAELELLFAGGIHDAVSSAIVQVLVAPLVERGAQVGILMGSAYLFTEEIVASGAIVPRFQQEVVACDHTVNLESGPGHASRCAYTPFAADFFRQRAEMRRAQVPGDEARRVLDDLILGRLRIASKGTVRAGDSGALQTLDEARQHAEGMYMLGQVATLRDRVTTIAALHGEVSGGAAELLRRRATEVALEATPVEAPARPADIAIVGIACLLPKAAGTREFWDNILAKVDAITEIPSHRWDWRLYFDADRTKPDKIYSKWGGFLDDLPFDPTRYGMPPNAVKSVDPMQLMALEVARRTLEDAGYDRKPFDRERASVIVGASGGTGDVGSQYGLRSELPRFAGELPAEVAARLPEWTEDSFAGILLNVISGRIANRLNFGGLNFTTDAACGSSLAAVYQGVTELVAGRSDFVISGGVDTVQGPFGYLCFSKTQALSPRGRCRTFDSTGDGIVISEGIAMVAMKRLADAERDGDRIYAVIKGVGGSSDGNAKGMTAPLPAGQMRAMRRAYAMAGFGPQTVGLFEAHGTGTVAGDTAELESTTALIREAGGAPRQSVVGSVKTNIGHTKATAGVAGLVKAALALHHRVLPPHLHVQVPNERLRDPASPLYVVDEALPWLDGEHPRRAAVSAFGFGGTNFHTVLEEYRGEYRPWLRPASGDRWPAELLLWSAADRDALAGRLEALQAQLPLPEGVLLRDVAASLADAWSGAAPERLAIVARDGTDLATKLAAAIAFVRGAAKALPPGVHHRSGAAVGGKVAVLFPGQGSQHPGMARELAVHFPAVAGALSEADRELADAFEARFGAGARLSHFVFPRGAYGDEAQAAARERLTATDVAQPALGAVEAGLWRLMQQFGLRADMTAGHSYGEFVAQHAAGAIDFASLMRLSAARGRFIVDAAREAGSELGTMAAAPADRARVEEAIADIDGVIIANQNAPQQSILSGPKAAVQAAIDKLAAAGIEAQPIPVAAAFHSSLVRPAQQPLAALIEATPWQPAAIPVYANATARPHPADVARSRRLMADHLVQPVEWVAEVEAMHADGARVFVEVGPKSVLTRLVGRILGDRPHLAVAIDDGQGLAGWLGAFAQLVLAGVPLDVAQLFERRDCRAGDPAHLAALSRTPPLPKTAWWINGAGVRRANEPVKQIGVTLEQAQAQASAPARAPGQADVSASPAAAVAAPAAVPVHVATTAPSPAPAPAATPPTISRRVPRMDERRPPPGTADAVLADYFETMRQFLETQERVMSAYLGQAPAARPAARLVRPAAIALPRAIEVPPAAAPVAPMATPTAVAAPAPAVAPAAVVASAPVAAPAPAPAPAAPVPVAAAPASPAGGRLSREAMQQQLLDIVEQKTGYPKDMIGLEQNLESDLGIDSIKRVEIVGAMLQALPEAHRQAMAASRGKLNTQPTLAGMLDLLAAAPVGEGAGVPFEVAETGHEVASHLPSRHVIVAQEEALDAGVPRKTITGTVVLVGDALGVASRLAARLEAGGCRIVAIDAELAADEPALARWCEAQRAAAGPVGAVIHLAALGRAPLPWDAAPEAVCREILVGQKSLHLILHALSDRLADDAAVVAASALGGRFGRDATAVDGLRLQGGAVGLLKSLREERPALRVKAIDLDPAQGAQALAAQIDGELTLDGGRQEVGYPGGRRTIFRTVAQPVDLDPAKADPGPQVVLATGGARGITAEVLRELARPGAVLVLAARSALVDEPSVIAACADAASLRAHLIGEVRRGALKLKPAEVEREVQKWLAQREMRANVADLSAAGARVECVAVDVTDGEALGALVEGIYARHGRLDGVVHGAGIIEDRLLAQKSAESWSRVVDTKVLGLVALQRALRPESLRFLTVFSSVAGRYGNSGQSDYATANELMNRLCSQLAARWGGRVNVHALAWGPWGATTHGAGMVTAETEAKFAAKGVTLVTRELGRRLFREELQRRDGGPVEVICGAGPWETHEAEVGAIRRAPAAAAAVPASIGMSAAAAPSLGPLLGAATVTAEPKGDQLVRLRLDARHRYLFEHVIDGTPVLPAAAALEMLAEAASALWPGWTVVEARDFRLLKGVELKGDARELVVRISPPPYGSSEGFEVTAQLQSELAPGRWLPHYRGTLRLAQQRPEPEAHRVGVHAERSLSPARAYGEWLFHGPRFQVIEAIDGLSAQGAAARVRSTHPSSWLARHPADGAGWSLEPALLDAAAQMAWLWARAFRDESALPARFGRVVRAVDRLPERLRMDVERVAVDDPSLVRLNVRFVDERGRVLFAVEELESIASPALNRLGGTARVAEEI